jgi:hypothetical protein
MLTLNDKIKLLLDYMPKDKWNFKCFVERKFNYPYFVLSSNNLQQAVTEYCNSNDLCEKCLDKNYCECKQ